MIQKVLETSGGQEASRLKYVHTSMLMRLLVSPAKLIKVLKIEDRAHT